MLLAFLCKWGAVGESQSWESNFQVKSEFKEEVPDSHFWQAYSNVFSVLGGDITDLYNSTFSLADKPPIFLSQIDPSGGWWYMSPPWSWERRSYHVFFLKLFRSTPQTYFCPLTLPNSKFSTFVILDLWLPSPYLSPLNAFKPHCPKEFSSFSLPWPWSCSAPLWHTDTTAELNQGHPAERDAKNQKKRW